MLEPMRSNARQLRSGLAVAIAIALVGCKADEGETCEGSLDCKEPLSCVVWDDVHADVLGPCGGPKCCLGETRAEEVETARQERAKQALRTKLDECNRLIEVINKEQGPLKEASGTDPAALRKLADTLDGVAKRVGAIELTDEKLVVFRNEYAQMATDLGKASRDTAAALADNDPSKAAEAAKTMSSFGRRESDVVDNIKKHCAGSR